MKKMIVMAMAAAIWPTLWATAPRLPATHSCLSVRTRFSPRVTKNAQSPPAAE